MDNLKKYFFAAALAGILYLGMGQVSFSQAQSSFTNGDFESFSSTSTSNASQGGSGVNDAGAFLTYTTGDALTSWTDEGYAFVFTTNTSLNGGTVTGADGAFALWSATNGGVTNIAAPPGGGNVIAMDGAYEVGPITQTITGLTSGQMYAVSFEWAGVQQQGTNYNSITMDSWSVALSAATNVFTGSNMVGGSGFESGTLAGSQTTTTTTNASHGFTGWMSQTFDFTATSTSETLYFLANGTPIGEPPFSLLADVTMTPVPEPITSSLWTLLFGMLIMFGNRAWHRYRKRPLTDPSRPSTDTS